MLASPFTDFTTALPPGRTTQADGYASLGALLAGALALGTIALLAILVATGQRLSVEFGKFVALASGFSADNDALPIRADARVLGATLKAGETTEYAIGADRKGYLVPSTGKVEVNGVALNTRDGAAIQDEAVIRVTAIEDAELVLVDAA